MRFGVLYRTSIPIADLARAEAVAYRPIREYGGWGIRGFGRRRALNMRGDRGVLLHRKDGSTILVGSQKPRELLAALGQAGVAVEDRLPRWFKSSDRSPAGRAVAGPGPFATDEEGERLERTLTILKPDSVTAGKAGAILAHLEKEGFRFLGHSADAPVAGAGPGLLRGPSRAAVLRRPRALHDRGTGGRRGPGAPGCGRAPAPHDGGDRLAEGRGRARSETSSAPTSSATRSTAATRPRTPRTRSRSSSRAPSSSRSSPSPGGSRPPEADPRR